VCASPMQNRKGMSDQDVKTDSESLPVIDVGGFS